MVSGASYTNYNYREFSFYHHFVAELYLSDLWNGKWLYFDNKYNYKAWSQILNISFETGYKFQPKNEQAAKRIKLKLNYFLTNKQEIKVVILQRHFFLLKEMWICLSPKPL